MNLKEKKVAFNGAKYNQYDKVEASIVAKTSDGELLVVTDKRAERQ